MPAQPETPPVAPTRVDPPPTTTHSTPHRQLDQRSPEALQTELLARMGSLEHTRLGASHISASTSVAVHLASSYASGPTNAFIARTEFAHLHGDGSGSLHMTLPDETASEAIANGWAERHPAATAGLAAPTLVMVYGPRDDAELEHVWTLVQRSYAFACNTEPAETQQV
jgi:hypothetical protein